MTTFLKRFRRDETGRALEGALLGAGSALLIIPTVNEIGTKLLAVFENISRALQ